MDYNEIKHKTVAQLREMAADIEHEAVRGYTQLNKSQLIAGVCTALGIDQHVHHEVVGVDKKAIKARIRQCKAERDEILKSGDRKKLKPVLRKIHHLKRQLHKAMV